MSKNVFHSIDMAFQIQIVTKSADINNVIHIFLGVAVRLRGQCYNHHHPIRSLGETSELHHSVQHEQELHFKWEMGIDGTKTQ